MRCGRRAEGRWRKRRSECAALTGPGEEVRVACDQHVQQRAFEGRRALVGHGDDDGLRAGAHLPRVDRAQQHVLGARGVHEHLARHGEARHEGGRELRRPGRCAHGDGERAVAVEPQVRRHRCGVAEVVAPDRDDGVVARVVHRARAHGRGRDGDEQRRGVAEEHGRGVERVGQARHAVAAAAEARQQARVGRVLHRLELGRGEKVRDGVRHDRGRGAVEHAHEELLACADARGRNEGQHARGLRAHRAVALPHPGLHAAVDPHGVRDAVAAHGERDVGRRHARPAERGRVGGAQRRHGVDEPVTVRELERVGAEVVGQRAQARRQHLHRVARVAVRVEDGREEASHDAGRAREHLRRVVAEAHALAVRGPAPGRRLRARPGTVMFRANLALAPLGYRLGPDELNSVQFNFTKNLNGFIGNL